MSECKEHKRLDRMCGLMQEMIRYTRMHKPALDSDGVKALFLEALEESHRRKGSTDYEAQKELSVQMWPIAWRRVLEAEGNN